MTTEDDFQAALDANPEDWQMRLVLADWLQERGDPRAEGYRALGRLRFRPQTLGSDEPPTWWWYDDGSDFARDRRDMRPEYRLPRAWYHIAQREWEVRRPQPKGKAKDCCNHDTRREAEDAAARAFAKLPAERRAELLAATPAAEEPKKKK
jgi:uncharacterized protein (TIGR02996 family)